MPFKNIKYAKEYYRKYHIKNRKKRGETSKRWRKNNRKRYNELVNKSYYRHRKKIIKKNSEYNRKRKKNDPYFKMLTNLRRRILLALKGTSKSANSLKLTGAPNWEFVWVHLEKQFKPGMTKENHGKWHIDHIIPCSHFDLTKPEEQAKCFHYTNLQPLWASENLSKGNRIS